VWYRPSGVIEKQNAGGAGSDAKETQARRCSKREALNLTLVDAATLDHLKLCVFASRDKFLWGAADFGVVQASRPA
jgi:hypothetical protein